MNGRTATRASAQRPARRRPPGQAPMPTCPGVRQAPPQAAALPPPHPPPPHAHTTTTTTTHPPTHPPPHTHHPHPHPHTHAPTRLSRCAKKSGVRRGRQRATSNSISVASVSKKNSTRSSIASGTCRACSSGGGGGPTCDGMQVGWREACPEALVAPAVTERRSCRQSRHGMQAGRLPRALAAPAAVGGATCHPVLHPTLEECLQTVPLRSPALHGSAVDPCPPPPPPPSSTHVSLLLQLLRLLCCKLFHLDGKLLVALHLRGGNGMKQREAAAHWRVQRGSCRGSKTWDEGRACALLVALNLQAVRGVPLPRRQWAGRQRPGLLPTCWKNILRSIRPSCGPPLNRPSGSCGAAERRRRRRRRQISGGGGGGALACVGAAALLPAAPTTLLPALVAPMRVPSW